MLQHRTEAMEDEDEELVEVVLGPAHVSKETAGDDRFMAPANEIKTLGGLSAVTKRRITNDIKKFHRGEGGAESKKKENDDVTGYDAFQVVQPPWNLDYLARLYVISEPNYAAISAKTANIVGLGYDFIESPKAKRKMEDTESEEAQAKLNKKFTRVKDDLLDRLDKMHQEDEFAETLSKVWTDYEATGNGYIEIGRTTSGRIGYIGHIPSTTMRVRRLRDGFVQIISNKAVFFRHFGDKKTKDPIGGDSRPNEVIHLKKYSPTSTYYGISDIVPAKNAIAGMEFASRFNLDYFENKAVPRYVITLQGAALSTAAERAVIEFFETGLQGKNHRTLYIPLPSGSKEEPVEFSMEPVEANVQDQSFEKYDNSNRDKILMAHRVPITKVSLAQGTNLAVARDADKNFKEQVCQPEQRILEKKLNRIMAEFTDIFLLKLNEVTLTDADTQSKIDERNVRNGIDLPNEVRSRRGMQGVEGGEKTMPLSTQQAADRKATAQQSRARDSARSASSSDSAGEARQPKGEGRASS